MYQNCEPNDNHITLHDCFAEKMYFHKGILSFLFPDGFWILANHPKNMSENTVRTNASQVDFEMINDEIENIHISIFRKNKRGHIIREDWESADFISAVNNGEYQIEFITKYESYQSTLFKCWVWFDKEPRHAECEIILDAKNAFYYWNALCYDRAW